MKGSKKAIPLTDRGRTTTNRLHDSLDTRAEPLGIIRGAVFGSALAFQRGIDEVTWIDFS